MLSNFTKTVPQEDPYVKDCSRIFMTLWDGKTNSLNTADLRTLVNLFIGQSTNNHTRLKLQTIRADLHQCAVAGGAGGACKQGDELFAHLRKCEAVEIGDEDKDKRWECCRGSSAVMF